MAGCGYSGCNTHNQTHEHEHQHSHDVAPKKQQVLLLIISILIFIIALLPINEFLKIGLFAISTILSGYDLIISGIKSLFKFKFEENVLMTIAVIAAFAIGEFPEACIVTILFKLGSYLENKAINKSKKDMEKLTQIAPDKANVLINEQIISKNAKQVNVNDIIIIRAGDKVPLDCIITEGQSSVDTSALTGEAIPLFVQKGDTLLSGSINTSGVLKCKVTKDYNNSTASQIIELVYASSAKKGKTENFITKFSKIYTPIVLSLAILLAFVPPLFGLGSFQDFINRALVFLLASCPCALVISVPLSFFSSIGANSRLGVLVKGSKYIEILSKVNCVAFDKTGTLTSGKLEIENIYCVDNYDKNYILNIAANMESLSSHPIAMAVLNYAKDYKKYNIENLEEFAGLGIKGVLDNKTILCGSSKLMINNNIEMDGLPNANIYISIENKIVGYIVLKEEIPKDNININQVFENVGVKKTVMLSGDNEISAQIIADASNVTEFYASLLPKDKVVQVEKLKQENYTCMFVGDGINDAPVLASADLGVSMGLGSEIANASSDIVLMNNNLKNLAKSITVSKKGMQITKFNIWFAIIVKFIVLTLGALGFIPIWIAIVADVGVSIISVLNSIRILSFNK